MRYRAAKELDIKELPCKILSRETTIEKLREIAIKDNSNFGEYDWDILANEWDDSPLEDWGVDLPTDWQESGNVNIDDFFTDADDEKKEKFVLKIEFKNEEQKWLDSINEPKIQNKIANLKQNLEFLNQYHQKND